MGRPTACNYPGDELTDKRHRRTGAYITECRPEQAGFQKLPRVLLPNQRALAACHQGAPSTALYDRNPNATSSAASIGRSQCGRLRPINESRPMARADVDDNVPHANHCHDTPALRDCAVSSSVMLVGRSASSAKRSWVRGVDHHGSYDRQARIYTTTPTESYFEHRPYVQAKSLCLLQYGDADRCTHRSDHVPRRAVRPS